MVRGRHAERCRELRRPPPRHARRPDRDHLRARRPERSGKHITYKELHTEVCRFANVLKELGVRKGDRVVLYLPMIPEAAYAMLACARIGAIHSIVFAGFSPDALSAASTTATPRS
jgi:acyl-coenzyme A synthetase/AMP-(fatty) acid ligase